MAVKWRRNVNAPTLHRTRTRIDDRIPRKRHIVYKLSAYDERRPAVQDKPQARRRDRLRETRSEICANGGVRRVRAKRMARAERVEGSR